jgi:hypothetical protein
MLLVAKSVALPLLFSCGIWSSTVRDYPIWLSQTEKSEAESDDDPSKRFEAEMHIPSTNKRRFSDGDYFPSHPDDITVQLPPPSWQFFKAISPALSASDASPIP